MSFIDAEALYRVLLGQIRAAYGESLIHADGAVLAGIYSGGAWLVPEAIVVVEEAVKSAFAAPDGFTELERRRYDDTEFVVLRLVTPV